MILSYCKFALRQIRHYKTYSIINVVGLSTGLAASFIILVYVRYQTSFDRQNGNLDNICVVTKFSSTFGWTEPETPLILGETIRNEIPGVTDVARLSRLGGTIQYNGTLFDEKRICFSDPDLFRILTIPLAKGSLDPAGKERDFFVISETLAMKYFRGRDPIGETITLKSAGATYEMKVTAVMKDFPPTSTMTADAIGPLYVAEKYYSDTWGSARAQGDPAWLLSETLTYVLLPPSARAGEINAKIQAISRRHADPAWETFSLFPLKDVYFHSSDWINNDFRHGDIANVYIYSAVAFLLLFIASANYLMLSLGRASLRSREVGVRKVFGAGRSDLFRQTLVEALIMTLLSLPVALALVELLLEDLTGLLGTTISGAYFHTWEYFLLFAVLTITVGAIAGSYISLYLSKFNPIDILKSRLAAGSRKVALRRILMASQMIIFLGLTLTSLTVYKQLRMVQTSDMGFDRENLALFYPENDKFGNSFEAFKNEMMKNPAIINISGASFLPMTVSKAVYSWPRKDHPDQKVAIEGLFADRDIVETMGMRMVAGVSFRNHAPGAPRQYCIINETAARELGLKEPLGEKVGDATVIGIVGDFNMHPLHDRIGPLQIQNQTQWINEVVVRIAPGDVQGTVRWIAEKGAAFNKGTPLEYESFEERVGDLYTHERKFARAIGYGTGLAIFVACLGIFGMSVFICQQKVKEIGIRKVLGAGTRDLYYRLTMEFVGLIFLSALVAFPLASFLAGKWLQQFVYRIDISAWDILLTAALDIVVVLATVSYQALKASSVNPVVSLRYE